MAAPLLAAALVPGAAQWIAGATAGTIIGGMLGIGIA